MNFKEVNINGKPNLINFDNVIQISESGRGCILYFNVSIGQGGDRRTFFINVDQSFDDIKIILTNK